MSGPLKLPHRRVMRPNCLDPDIWPLMEEESQPACGTAPDDHPDGGVIDSGLWVATLLDPPHDIEGAEHRTHETSPQRVKLLKDYPLQTVYEEFLEDYFEGGVHCELAFHQFILMEDLRLAWLACKAIFNEQATPEVAWKIYLETKKEAAEYARSVVSKEEGGPK